MRSALTFQGLQKIFGLILLRIRMIRLNQRGQGLIEYLVLVALMGVATIAIVRTMGQTVSARFASVTYALQCKRKSIESKIDDSQYKRKDLGNFFDGVDDRAPDSNRSEN